MQSQQRISSSGIQPSKLSAEPVLQLEGLEKIFRSGRRSVKAVSDFNLTIARGEVVGLVGESGSGKSTVARLVAQLHTPTRGTIRLNGQTLPARPSSKALLEYRRKVQMIFQDPFSSLNPTHTVGYALSRPLEIHGLSRGRDTAPKVRALLERVGLSPGAMYEQKFPHELSGGQRQRVGIARALAVQPALILADEPTSMLDVSIRLDIMNLMLDLRDQEGLSYLFITHDLAGARYMSDRVAVMYAGNLVEIGGSAELIGSPAHPYTRLLKSAAPKPESGLEPDRVEARGEVPDLTQLPPGCPFEPRCPYARAECRAGLPRLVEVARVHEGHSHEARCVLYYPELGAPGIPGERVGPSSVKAVS
jgi:peptide/nickel transport system ATP-binding protein